MKKLVLNTNNMTDLVTVRDSTHIHHLVDVVSFKHRGIKYIYIYYITSMVLNLDLTF